MGIDDMARRLRQVAVLAAFVVCGAVAPWGCSTDDGVTKADALPEIFPDYVDVAVPCNIAPLNFMLRDCDGRIEVRLSAASSDYTFIGDGGKIGFPLREWKELLKREKGGTVKVGLKARKEGRWIAYPEFTWEIMPDSINGYVAYDRMAPDNAHGTVAVETVRRETGGFAEETVADAGRHFFCRDFPDNAIFRGRTRNGVGAYVVDTAFATYVSVFPDKRRESVGLDGTVVVADYGSMRYVTLPDSLAGGRNISFVELSADAGKLFCCVFAAAFDPDSVSSLKYDLVSVDLDRARMAVGGVADTVVCLPGVSVSYPVLSPDGRFMAYSVSSSGASAEWHDESDMRLTDLLTGRVDSLDAANSPVAADVVRGWSANSRWLMFSSKRDDGFYERIYFSHIDSAGRARKPFMLPQMDAEQSYYMMEVVGNPAFF